MTHPSDDELVLHYYGESRESTAHIASCASCTARADDLALLLGSIRDDVPARGEHYGLEVWQRVRPHLERGQRRWRLPAIRWAVAAAAAATIAVSAFLAGRLSNPASKADVSTTPTGASRIESPDARRVLLLSVADHLERSDRVLTEIMNAPRGVDLDAEQQWAVDLVAANRLYRQDAVDAHEASVADVLDDLERVLLDIVHRPADTSATDLDQIRRRIDSAALLFKVRMMSNELRQRQLGDTPASQPPVPIS